jgi:hypothetical protein
MRSDIAYLEIGISKWKILSINQLILLIFENLMESLFRMFKRMMLDEQVH